MADPVKTQGGAVNETSTKVGIEKVHYVSEWALMVMSGVLTCGLALAAAALSGHSGGWFTFKQQNFHYFLWAMFPRTAPANLPFTLKFWIGWVRGTSTLRMHMHRIARTPAWRYLKEGGMIGQVVGAGEAFLLIISLLASVVVLVQLLVSFLRSTERLQAGKLTWLRNGPHLRSLWIFSALFSAALGVLSILFYAMMAIGVARESVAELEFKCVIWPDWAWWFAILVAAFWGLVAAVARHETLVAKMKASADGNLPFVT